MPGAVVTPKPNTLHKGTESNAQSQPQQTPVSSQQQNAAPHSENIDEIDIRSFGLDEPIGYSLQRGLDDVLTRAFDIDQGSEHLTVDYLPDPSEVQAAKVPLRIGRAVDNHRPGKIQEDRHFTLGFPMLSAEDSTRFLSTTIAMIDDATRDDDSGSTFTGVLVTETGDVVTAHLGDSPVSAIIIRSDGTLGPILQLTKDHKVPTKPAYGTAIDGTRFQDFNGRRNLPIGHSINMTHALGNRAFGAALCRNPELQTHHIQRHLLPGDRLFLLITTDGAHNEQTPITHTAHAEIIQRNLKENTPLNRIACEISNASAALQDNVTVVLLEVEVGKGACVAVFDGHAGPETAHGACRLFESYAKQFAQANWTHGVAGKI